MRIPSAPGGIGKRLMIGRERAAGLSLMGRDDLFGRPDLPLQLGDDLLRLVRRFRAGDPAKGKSGRLEMLQRFTVLSDLSPMPRDFTVTVCNHLRLPKGWRQA